MKKIFILTGEPSGDKLAAKVISKLKIKDPSIIYLCLGGEELKSLGKKMYIPLFALTIGLTFAYPLEYINPHNYCVPVAKDEIDLLALRKYACSGNRKFFLGTDSRYFSSSKDN